MNTEIWKKAIEEQMIQLLKNEADYFLVEVSVQAGPSVKVLVDGKEGISIGQLTNFSRVLYKWAEENGVFPNNDFSLEVSSPGLDEPLKLHQQYVKNIGREVEVVLKNGIKVEGNLVNVDELEIVVEEKKGKGKKMKVELQSLLFTDIKTTKVQIKF